MEYTGVVCDVYPYSDSYKPLIQVPVVEAVSAYDHPTGEMFILVLAQALYLRDKQAQCLPLRLRIIMRQATSQVLHMLATNSQK